MYDKGKIIPGLIVFIGLMSFPIWYNMGNAGKPPVPEKAVGATECVEPAQIMRTSHMVLLNDWRDNVVRDKGARFGKTQNQEIPYERSLQKGCMKCHASKKKFCDTCHEYTAVKPYCWDCHIAPKEMN